MIESGEFDFFNMRSGDTKAIPWSAKAFPRLWLYHLNYFDFVNLDLTQPMDWPLLRRALLIMVDWCEWNSTGREAGWEPYPLSLRAINWMKFLLRNASQLGAGGEEAAVTEILSSLRCQVLVLEKKLEFHLRANHLLKNIKALIFAGALLETSECGHWWTRGVNLLEGQLREQILPDGGHFERSPMYHAEVLEDLLDLKIVTAASGHSLACMSILSEKIDRMSDFLAAMLHPDGEIPLFNDSTFGIAAAPRELLSRAGRQGEVFCQAKHKVEILPDTGYAVIREPNTGSCLIFDCGPLGPNEQPGHAHCDVLSYELSLDGRRVVVDTGVSGYEPGLERQYERSTAAHNTVRVDGMDQAEIWASFRVGRRPEVEPIENGQVGGFRFVRGSHQAYRRLGVVHDRQIILCPGSCWVVVDCLRGKGRHLMESFVHFHPDVKVEACADLDDSASLELQKRCVIQFAGHRYFLLTSRGGSVALKEAWYSPQFGRREKQAAVYWRWEGALQARFVYAFVPADSRFPEASLQADGRSIKIDNVCIPLS